MSVDWDALTRTKREKTLRKALKSGDIDLLVHLTMHNLLAYGRGGPHTSLHTTRGYTTGSGPPLPTHCRWAGGG